MNLMKLKGHSSMLGANVMWGLMSPVAKFVMVGGAVTPLVVTDLRITGAMVLFWIASFFQKPERVAPKDLLKLLGASLLAIVFNQGCFIFGVGLTSPVDAVHHHHQYAFARHGFSGDLFERTDNRKKSTGDCSRSYRGVVADFREPSGFGG